ncbi:UNVERIFIED_CONTAM: Retrovirus-related Pol polyprotein from transposon TNT 1-94 [Sesamum calycinum]|uniref:Retrovirus-related Pol polyprotein from transposon TNT 1-94 n=1 Tax=Sesamum calycinum TaxID=2727403 RepID=A0AAW2R8N4_9LAMI
MNGAANPTASSTVYRGESSSIGMHKMKLEAKLGLPPKQMEVFERCYNKRRSRSCWRIIGLSQRLMRVIPRLNRSSEAHFSSRTYTSPPIPPSLPPPSNPAVKDRIGRLEEMMADMMVMMREMQASSSTTGPSQSTVSSTAPAQPPTDTYPPNNDEMGGVKSTELTHGDYHMEALEAWSTSHHKPCPVQPKYEARMVSFKKRIRPLSLHNRARRIKDPIFWCGVDELWRIPVLESCVNKRRKEEESINFKKMSKNPLILIMETNKSNGTNYNYWLRNLRIVPNFENQGLSWTSRFQRPGLRGPLPKNVSRSRNGLRTTTRATASTKGAPAAADGKGKGKGKVRGSQRLKANDVCMNCQGKGYWKKECPQLLSNPGMFVIEVNMITNAASWILDGCGAHICNNLQVLGRSRKLSKDEMILRLGDRKAVVAEAVGSLNLVIDDHIRIELKDCYSVPSMIKNIISIPILDNNGYAFKINKNGFYLMIDDNYHLFGTLGYALETAAKFLNMAPSKMVTQTPYEIWHGNPTSYKESRLPERYGFVGLTSQLDNDPKTYGEAMSDIDSDKWLEAMKSKMDSIDSNQVWTLVDPPKGIKPVVCKWVYNHKLQADGEVTAFKARLVVKGYTQQPGVDFEETYSPVAMAKSTRILLAIAICRRISLLLEKNKGLSSLKVHLWPQTSFSKLEHTFDEVVRGYDFIKNENDPCVYKKDMGEASYILGIKIYRDRSRKMLGLTQSSYIEKVLKRFKMENSKRGFFPMRHGIKLSKKQSPKTYEELKRMLDISYTSVVGSIQCCPVHQALCRLRFEHNEWISGMRRGDALDGYSNASFQSDDDDAKSQSGFVFKLNGGVVAWKSSKQATTSDSTTEAEYITTSEVVWMKNYIQELGVVPSIAEPVVIFCDNNRVITQAKNRDLIPFQTHS